MAINQNHLFEELNGVKCAIVEKNVAPARVEFLRGILEYNGFTVVVVPSPPPKAVPGVAAPASAEGSGPADTAAPAPAPLFAAGARNVYGWGNSCDVQRGECCFREVVEDAGRTYSDVSLLAAKREGVA